MITAMHNNRGIALVVVLWALTVIAVISANFTTANRDGLLLARNTVERAKAEAMADAGFYRAVLAIVNQEAEPETTGGDTPVAASAGFGINLDSVRAGFADGTDPQDIENFGEFGPPTWRTNGKIYEWPLSDGSVLISIQDEAGKIDLNAATEDLLNQLFATAGLGADEVTAMVDRLIDFRDTDQERRAFGAEDIDYQRAQVGYGAKDRPFERTDEVRRIFGMTPTLYAALAPLITVHSGQRGVDPNVAPPGVLGVLGAAGAAVDISEPAAQVNPEAGQGRLTQRGDRRNQSRSRQRTFTITAEARTAGGGIFVREAIVELTGNRDAPLMVHQWEQARFRLGASTLSGLQ